MPWVRIDDRLTEHPKILAAGPLAIAMQVAGLCYCNRELTDGFIPRAKARSLLDWQIVREDGHVYEIGVASGMSGTDVDCQWVIDLMVESGIWEQVEGGYQIHDYGDYQPSKDQVLSERESAARRQGDWRARNKGSNAVSNAVTNASNNNPVTPAPVPNPVPVPSAFDKADKGEPNGSAPAGAREEPQPADPPHNPNPPKPKPRSESQKRADALYERRFAIFEAYCRGLGIDPESMPGTQRKGPSLDVLTVPILDSPECDPETIEPLTRYTLSAFQWRHGAKTPSLREVLAAFPEWEQQGRPDRVPGKPPPGYQHGRASPNGKSHDESWAEVDRIRESTQQGGGTVIEASYRTGD